MKEGKKVKFFVSVEKSKKWSCVCEVESIWEEEKVREWREKRFGGKGVQHEKVEHKKFGIEKEGKECHFFGLKILTSYEKGVKEEEGIEEGLSFLLTKHLLNDFNQQSLPINKEKEQSLPINKEKEQSLPINKEKEQSLPINKEKEQSLPINKEKGGPMHIPINKSRNFEELSSKVGEVLEEMMRRDVGEKREERERREKERREEEEKKLRELKHFFLVEEEHSTQVDWIAKLVEKVDSELGRVLLVGYYGSRRYNLHNLNSKTSSDVDLVIVYEASPLSLLSLSPPSHIHNHTGFAPDFVIIELSYFFQQICSGDSKTGEIIFQKNRLSLFYTHPSWSFIHQNSKHFLTQQLFGGCWGELNGKKGFPFVMQLHLSLLQNKQLSRSNKTNQEENKFEEEKSNLENKFEEEKRNLEKKWYVVFRLLFMMKEMSKGEEPKLWLEEGSEERKFLVEIREGKRKSEELLQIFLKEKEELEKVWKSLKNNSLPIPQTISPSFKQELREWILQRRVLDWKERRETKRVEQEREEKVEGGIMSEEEKRDLEKLMLRKEFSFLCEKESGMEKRERVVLMIAKERIYTKTISNFYKQNFAKKKKKVNRVEKVEKVEREEKKQKVEEYQEKLVVVFFEMNVSNLLSPPLDNKQGIKDENGGEGTKGVVEDKSEGMRGVVFYSIRKIIQLILESNVNVISLLYNIEERVEGMEFEVLFKSSFWKCLEKENVFTSKLFPSVIGTIEEQLKKIKKQKKDWKEFHIEREVFQRQCLSYLQTGNSMDISQQKEKSLLQVVEEMKGLEKEWIAKSVSRQDLIKSLDSHLEKINIFCLEKYCSN